ncbi:GntR family transcriptional regulator [Cupriavidus basilensis]
MTARQPLDSNLFALLTPRSELMLVVEQALLRGQGANASLPIAEQIAGRLASLIAVDILRPGQRLNECELGEVFGVSPSPIREAIRILERDRLVEVYARRGAVVTAPNARELRDIFTVREALFSILFEQVMRERQADLIAVLAAYVPRLANAAAETSPMAYALENFSLNMAMTNLCSNRLVVDQLTTIGLRTMRYVLLGLSSSALHMRNSLQNIRTLQSAVEKGDIALLLSTSARRIDAIREMAVAAITSVPADCGGT